MSRLRVVFVAALASILATPALAVMIEAPFEELVSTSDLVVRGRVVSTAGRFQDPQTRVIVTDVTVRVDEVWAGSVGDSRMVTFTVIGGEVGKIGMRQSHQPVFATGEEAVVFLRSAGSGHFAVTLAEQGKFTVLGDEVISFKRVPLSLQRMRSDVARLKPARGR